MKSQTIGAEQRAKYAHDGLLFPITVLSPDDAKRYRDACDELERTLGGKPRTVEVRQMHLHYSWAYELSTTPRILDAVEALLGPDLLIWATELFSKHPQDPSVAIAWHRDTDYMGFDSSATLTAWVALSPCTPANGCLMAVPGPARRSEPALPAPGSAPRTDLRAIEARATCVLLEPGQMSLHDSEIVHGSLPNRSNEKRVGFAIRYIAPSVRPRHGRPEVVVARGRDQYGHFKIVEGPKSVSADEALQGLRRSALQHFDAVLENLSDR